MASQCVALQVDGTLVVLADPVASCPGHILVDGAEYAQLMAEPTLMDLFSVPVAADLQTMFVTGFSLPMIVYLVAWGYQQAIGFVNSRG